MARQRPGLAGMLMVVVTATVLLNGRTPAQDRRPADREGEWTSYHANTRGHHYSPLDQVNGSNFSNSKSRGGSRPTASVRGPTTSSKARR